MKEGEIVELKFNLRSYQEEAVSSVVDLFEGMELQHSKFDKSKSTLQTNQHRNALSLSKERILANLNTVQQKNSRAEAPIEFTTKLKELDFTIEMETGTGKTFVYYKTIMELNKKYGWNKFLIIVPSVAIREGVISEFARLKSNFEHEYKQPIFAYVYDSQKLEELEGYNRSSFIEIMIMTMQAFNKDQNVLNQEHLDKTYNKPMNLLSELRPIVILDEPQKMGGDATKSKLKDFNALFTLRYSATHNEIVNLIYRYTPFDAYQDNYVKKIEVLSVYGNDMKDINAYIEVLDVTYDKNDKLYAQLKFYQRQDANIKLISRRVRQSGYDIYEKSHNMIEYKGYIVTEINPAQGYVKIQTPQGDIVVEKNKVSQDKDELMRIQIKETIREHFEKEIKFNDLLMRKELNDPIKVLSLFFIDKVANFRGIDGNKGKIARWFEEAYRTLTLKERYKRFATDNINSVYEGYFAVDQISSKNVKIYKDTVRENKEDRAAYKLIMKDKEKLLSFHEPVRFIFSHSALREGWDNPNVFQICTLNETIKETRKRQEIGRGLRLPVDITGERIQDQTVNTLTVVANESYDTFARSLQEEISVETGIKLERNITRDGRQKEPVKINKNSMLSREFLRLWEKISNKTTYNLKISTDKIINKVVKQIKHVQFNIEPKTYKVQKTQIDELTRKNDLEHRVTLDRDEIVQSSARVPNIIKRISDSTGLTKKTIINIIQSANIEELIFNNPEEFINRLSQLIKTILPELLLDGIKYEPIGDNFSSTLFKDEIEVYTNAKHTVSDLDTERTLYPALTLDSENEIKLIKKMNVNHAKVNFYIKLPNWFTVATPAGNYNPDWAIAMKDKNNKDILYLVRESKSTKGPYFNKNELRHEEQLKIEYGKKHFDSIDVDYQVIENFNHIREGVYPFETTKIPIEFIEELKDKKAKDYNFDTIKDFYGEQIKEYSVSEDYYNKLK